MLQSHNLRLAGIFFLLFFLNIFFSCNLLSCYNRI
jgi:hypothetical protein